jgi:hypothetical protein
MRPERRRVVSGIVGATLLLGVLLAIRPIATSTLVAAYVLVLAAIGVASLTRVLAGEPDLRASAFERELSLEPVTPNRPPDLVRVEREITLGISTAGHLHLRLLPLLREAAAARLGYELDLRPALARQRLGDDLWKLLRPDRPEPEDRHAPGASVAEIRRVVDRLETL